MSKCSSSRSRHEPTAGRPAGGAERARRLRKLGGALLVTAGLVATLGAAAAPATASSRTTAPTWRQLHPAKVPPARENGSMAYDPATHQVVLFGGLGNNINSLADTWIWNGTTWKEVFPSHQPSARFGASLAYDGANHTLVLFGGEEVCCGLGDGGQLNDTWTWNGTTWKELSPATSPGPRAYASMAYDPVGGLLVLFGGENPNVYSFYGDTWTWNGRTWKEASASTSGLSARDEASMAFDGGNHTLVLFGGSNSSGTDLNDTWTWSGTAWRQSAPAHSPPTLSAACMGYDGATNQLVLFGGEHAVTTPQLENETWTWSGTSWTELNPSAKPPVRSAATMAYDATSEQLLVFSGYPSLDDTWSWGVPVRLPGDPRFLKATAGRDKVTLSWKAPTPQSGGAVAGYDVFEGTKSGHESSTPLNASPLSAHADSYVVTGLKKGHRYYFIVRAVNAAGVGAPSNQVSAVPT